ncbi:hypothetical protein K491DRAFT_649316 [Lophiostoma macrostomum CBS 122681]|uniref:Guanine nucleotide-exchange factor SEC12 n=1 Tax=Lophiostoma macrostomum CBS 122681 TaxID=1314788 RepID=A0A6A6TM69_9PLEO|nr:hypothetical protein K491DRAFT_649316 [Lophiostoma macrostomum CBS 122681]
MSPPSVSKASVKYPIFAATWSYNNPAILTVGGGGGAGNRSGVPNAISCFDTSSRAPTLEPFAEIELSRDDDSVTCLSNLATKDGSILYAGINSSEAERLKGKNEHFRAFEVFYPKKTANDARDTKTPERIQFVSKIGLLSPVSSESAKKDGYQRLIRLSPPRLGQSGAKRIAALSSSLAESQNELVILAAVSNKPLPSEVIQRVGLGEKEANDIDIVEPELGQFSVAYCLDQEVFVQNVGYDFDRKKVKNKLEAPRKKYAVPYPDTFEKAGRSRIRCIRWLSSNHCLLLANSANRTGVELLVLHLYNSEGMGSIITRKRLPGHVKQAVDMDISRLDADENGAYQVVIAIAAQDVSLHLYTIEYRGNLRDSFSGFTSYAVYRDVHPVQMTKIALSPFSPPEPSSKPRPQYLRLASASLGNTVTVDTFRLHPLSSRPNSRHVLTSERYEKFIKTAQYLAGAFIALMLALMFQSLIDPEGNLTKSILPKSIQNAAGRLQAPGGIVDEVHRAKLSTDGVEIPVAKAAHRLRDLLHLHHSDGEEASQKALVIHHDPELGSSLSTEVHASSEDIIKKHTDAKTWEELSQAERKRWKDKLIDAGMWTVEEGETILKSIFFGQVGGLVGQVAQGVMHG